MTRAEAGISTARAISCTSTTSRRRWPRNGRSTCTGRLVGVAGKSYPPVELTLEAEQVAAFARVIGADPGAGVPPTYAAVYALFATFPQLLQDSEAAVDFAHLVHAEQEFSWERHPEVGETVTAVGTVTGDDSRRNLRFLKYETAVSAESGPVCASRMTSVIRA
ncbi:MAG: MaoC family dehydratase [Chloroflexi bacterium]|nr:MAG: MaoC family dehydratase [Chloroflexota bacterium]TME15924.1 MAG: MaoC family dehydratase [Chloroflexota bacterium]TME18733.1 MAG: MaoC family dehydratase [Chloroflexota bacterium]